MHIAYSFSVLNKLKASIIPLKLMLGALEFLHFTFVLMNRLNKTESAVFYYNIVGSLLFLKESFSRLFRVS